jgi:hypothetical protein
MMPPLRCARIVQVRVFGGKAPAKPTSISEMDGPAAGVVAARYVGKDFGTVPWRLCQNASPLSFPGESGPRWPEGGCWGTSRLGRHKSGSIARSRAPRRCLGQTAVHRGWIASPTILVCFADAFSDIRPASLLRCRTCTKNASPANLRGASYVSPTLQGQAHPWSVSGAAPRRSVFPEILKPTGRQRRIALR